MPEAVLIAEIEKNSRDVIRVSIDEFKGHHLVDIRTFSAWGEGDELKAGISLNVEKLPDLIAALARATAEAERRCFLPRATLDNILAALRSDSQSEGSS